MRLRCAVPKTSPKSSVPGRSPIHKPRLLPTHSESTLPQVLIPLRFKSFLRNAYKKPEGEGPLRRPKFVNSLLRTIRSYGPHTNAPQIQSCHGFTSHFPVYRRVCVMHRHSVALAPLLTALPAFQFAQSVRHRPRTRLPHHPRLAKSFSQVHTVTLFAASRRG